MSTLFIADLHLEDERPDLNRAFLSFCRTHAPAADSLYILGDLFNAWIGDDDDSDTAKLVAIALSALSDKGVNIFLQHGNRDFLIGETFAQSCGATLLPDSIVIEPYGQPILLMHGDQLCLEDVDYQQFRQMVRDSAWQHTFLAKSLAERQQIAEDLRQKSREANRVKAEDIMDVTSHAVVKAMQDNGVELLIHGHTHRPHIHTLSEGHRVVLGDWGDSLWFLQLAPDNQYQLIEENIPEF